MPPNFTVTYISGWHFPFPPSLAIRPALLGVAALFRARGLAKATRPLTCTHFDPAIHPRFPLHLGLPCTPCQHGWKLFCQIAPNRAEKVSGGLLSTFLKQGHKSPHGRPQEVTGLSGFPVRTHQSHSSKGFERHCRIYRDRKSTYISIKRLVPVSVTVGPASWHPNLSMQRNPCLFSVNISLPVFYRFRLFLIFILLLLKVQNPASTDVCRTFLAPRVGLEPTTTRLTAECSTIELSRISEFLIEILLSFSFPWFAPFRLHIIQCSTIELSRIILKGPYPQNRTLNYLTYLIRLLLFSILSCFQPMLLTIYVAYNWSCLQLVLFTTGVVFNSNSLYALLSSTQISLFFLLFQSVLLTALFLVKLSAY